MDEFYDFTVDCIRGAGNLLKELYHSDFSISHKGGDARDVVTGADLQINRLILDKIHKKFPDHAVYSEETDGVFESVGRHVWTIDPIDGTSNFSRHIPHFAICLGLMKDGTPLVGAVYNPVTDELFSFRKGEGVFFNNQKIQPSSETDLHKSFILLHAGRSSIARAWGAKTYGKIIDESWKVSNLACSSLDICFVAAGRVEATIYGTLTTLDVAPAIGILEEAGGEFVIPSSAEKFSKAPRKILAAGNAVLRDKLLQYL